MFQKHKAREDKESISFSTKELQKRRAYCCIKKKKKAKRPNKSQRIQEFRREKSDEQIKRELVVD